MKVLEFPVTPSDFKKDVIEGLSRKPKRLSPKFFYDHRGSELFDQITKTKDYYPTRTELSIYEEKAEEMVSVIGKDPLAVIELGSGSNRKIKKLISLLEGIQYYVPVDISGEFLEKNAKEIHEEFEDLEVRGVIADYTQDWHLPEEIEKSSLRRLFYFPGSTVGNLEQSEALDLLKSVRKIMGDEGYLLIGVDTIKNAEILEQAYDDSEGVTAQFNLNVLGRMKRELGAKLEIEAFEHRAIFNKEKSRIEMHLVANTDTQIQVGGESFDFQKGEGIHTESSHKYSIESFEKLAFEAGLKQKAVWTDDKKMFSVRLFEALR